MKAREQLCDRREHIVTLRVASVAGRLDMTLEDLTRQRHINEALRRDYEEVTEDHNRLIQQLTLAGHDRFTRRAEGYVKLPAPSGEPRLHEHRRGSASLAVVREHHESM